MKALNLFAGPGGTCTGCRDALGVDPYGIELDAATCETRKAAGLPYLRADVALFDPTTFAPVDLLLASPPCPPWSQAGQRAGEHDWELVHELTDLISHRSFQSPTPLLGGGSWEHPHSRLITEPLRYALALKPRWIMLEQVPPVLDYWHHLADVLKAHGWSCWSGILEAERYGVPQTRERAFLIADRERQPHPPAPTHQRYVPGEVAQNQLTIEGELLPWVSMADALGWGMTERPSVTVPATSDAGGGPRPLDGGNGAREILRREKGAGRWLVQSALERATVRAEDEPAPTITGADDFGERRWVFERPATTVAGDHRIFRPGSHHANDGRNSTAETHGRSDEAIRVSPEEAAVLQGFPADYPFRGNLTQRHKQIGNAVPPPWAAAVLRALVGARVAA